jgi:hypothetical protein
MELFSQRIDLKQRNPSYKAADKAALQAIAQAAVDVELFTIPLYMVSLYSIVGRHQITSAGNNFYQGRLWPGRAPSRAPDDDSNPANAHAFNLLFSVFIDEMLHLQLAANIAKVLGVTPSFTSPVLMNARYGWKCYGPGKTVIPHILDLKDTDHYKLRVDVGALTKEQNRLFLAIEESDDEARSIIRPDERGKYFPEVPFGNWQATSTEADLPMFGTIGHMYKCLWEYMEIEYTDHTTLFDSVFDGGALERDLFNSTSGHHVPEYPNMPTMVSQGPGGVDNPRMRILGMINAITDQGEGKGVAQWISQRLDLPLYTSVQAVFQPNETALNTDYPNFTDFGTKHDPSGNTVARVKSGGLDHYERFVQIGKLLEDGLNEKNVVTWDQWHAEGGSWSGEMLETTGHQLNVHPIPEANDVADALNSLKYDRKLISVANHETFSQIATGAIAGITRVLRDFWTNENTAFPSPSMYGSGDRVSICWAIFGAAPDLSQGIDPKVSGTLYNACQGLNLAHASGAKAQCAPIPVAHSCRGSNTCQAEGGCGFVQLAIGPQPGCGFKALREHVQPMPADASAAGTTKQYSAPSDNHCAGFGGCAVPISASQMFPPPADGPMVLFDFTGKEFDPVPITDMKFKAGELVYDVAWKAYIEVLKHRAEAERREFSPPAKPRASKMRLALPPST